MRRLNSIQAQHCPQPYDTVEQDTWRAVVMTAEEARAYGIADHILRADPARAFVASSR